MLSMGLQKLRLLIWMNILLWGLVWRVFTKKNKLAQHEINIEKNLLWQVAFENFLHFGLSRKSHRAAARWVLVDAAVIVPIFSNQSRVIPEMQHELLALSDTASAKKLTLHLGSAWKCCKWLSSSLVSEWARVFCSLRTQTMLMLMIIQAA